MPINNPSPPADTTEYMRALMDWNKYADRARLTQEYDGLQDHRYALEWLANLEACGSFEMGDAWRRTLYDITRELLYHEKCVGETRKQMREVSGHNERLQVELRRVQEENMKLEADLAGLRERKHRRIRVRG